MSNPTVKTIERRRAPGRTSIPSKRLMPRAEEKIFRLLVGARFREAREALGVTQYELGTQLGVSQGRIAHYETGLALPLFSDVPKLCRALKCDPNFLLNFSSD